MTICGIEPKLRRHPVESSSSSRGNIWSLYHQALPFHLSPKPVIYTATKMVFHRTNTVCHLLRKQLPPPLPDVAASHVPAAKLVHLLWEVFSDSFPLSLGQIVLLRAPTAPTRLSYVKGVHLNVFSSPQSSEHPKGKTVINWSLNPRNLGEPAWDDSVNAFDE